MAVHAEGCDVAVAVAARTFAGEDGRDVAGVGNILWGGLQVELGTARCRCEGLRVFAFERGQGLGQAAPAFSISGKVATKLHLPLGRSGQHALVGVVEPERGQHNLCVIKQHRHATGTVTQCGGVCRRGDEEEVDATVGIALGQCGIRGKPGIKVCIFLGYRHKCQGRGVEVAVCRVGLSHVVEQAEVGQFS